MFPEEEVKGTGSGLKETFVFSLPRIIDAWSPAALEVSDDPHCSNPSG